MKLILKKLPNKDLKILIKDAGEILYSFEGKKRFVDEFFGWVFCAMERTPTCRKVVGEGSTEKECLIDAYEKIIKSLTEEATFLREELKS